MQPTKSRCLLPPCMCNRVLCSSPPLRQYGDMELKPFWQTKNSPKIATALAVAYTFIQARLGDAHSVCVHIAKPLANAQLHRFCRNYCRAVSLSMSFSGWSSPAWKRYADADATQPSAQIIKNMVFYYNRAPAVPAGKGA